MSTQSLRSCLIHRFVLLLLFSVSNIMAQSVEEDTMADTESPRNKFSFFKYIANLHEIVDAGLSMEEQLLKSEEENLLSNIQPSIRNSFVRIGRSATGVPKPPFFPETETESSESLEDNTSPEKRGHYFKIGRLPSSAFLRSALRNFRLKSSGKPRSRISKSTIIRMG